MTRELRMGESMGQRRSDLPALLDQIVGESPPARPKRRRLYVTPDVLYAALPVMTPREHQVLQMFRRLGIVRTSELEAHGVPRGQLYRLVRKGLVERQARGIYVASKHPFTAEHTLAQVAKRVPGGVLCLLTALRLHELTTQAPAEVWIALPEKARKP